MSKDYYKILELNKNATQEDIKKNYKKLALKYHPDRNNGDEQKFKELTEAYETLSDSQKRHVYDNPQPKFQMINNSNLFNDLPNIMKQFHNMHMNEHMMHNSSQFPFSFNIHNQQPKRRGNCSRCLGTGMITQVIQKPGFRMQQTSTCNLCNGSGNS